MTKASEETKQARFIKLLDPIWKELARYCNAIAKDHEAARDLMAETLATAFQDLEKLRADDAFKRYLFVIARRVHHRSRRKSHHEAIFEEAMLDTLNHDGLEAERSLAALELYAALQQLPEKQREAIILFDISGLSLNEVQEIQGGSLSRVKTRIARGRETLGLLLEAPRTSNVNAVPTKSFVVNLLTTSIKAKL